MTLFHVFPMFEVYWGILWCTDVAKWALHPRPTLLPVCRYHVWVFFFFGICSDLAPIRADSRWTGPIRPKSGGIGRIRSYWPAAETSWNWPWITPEQLKSALNEAQTSLLNFILNICCFFCVFFLVLCFVYLAFFFLCFVNQGHIMCFLRIF